MKKLMAMIGAVVMSFGLFAAVEGTYYSTSFETVDAGCDSGETFDVLSAEGWSTTSGSPFALVAQDTSALPYEDGTKARRDEFFNGWEVNKSCLKLEIPANTLECAIGTGRIFVDQLVKFSEYDNDPALVEGAKIAVWMKADDSGESSLYASVGTGSEVKNVQIAGDYESDKWYRLTIKALDNVLENGTQAGFLIYVNGELVSIVEADREYLDAEVADDLLETASDYYSKGCLFASIDVASTEISTVGYTGYGAIDDLIISEEAPKFAQDPYTFTINPQEGLEVVSVEANGETLEEPYIVPPGTVVRITYKATEGYKITSEKAHDDVTILEDGQEITDTDVEFGEVVAELYNDSELVENYVADELYEVINSLKDGDQLLFVHGVEIFNPEGESELLYMFDEGTTIDVSIDGDLTTWTVNSETENGWIIDNVGAEENVVKTFNLENMYSTVQLGGDVAGKFSVVWGGERDEESALCIDENEVTITGVATAADIVINTSITLSGEGKVITQNGELEIGAEEGDVEKLENIPEDGWFTYQIKTDDESVARIGDVKFATLAEALEAADDTDEIELLKDIELTSKMEIDKAITLNLSGKTISVADGDYDSAAILVTASGATIKNGSVLSAATSPVAACFIDFSEASGTLEDLTVNTANFKWGVGGDLPGDDQWKKDYDTYTVTCRNVKVTGPTSLFQAEGVNLELDADCSATQSGAHAEDWRNCAIHAGFNAIVRIAGGEYTGKYAIYKMSSPAKIYVNGGTFTGDVYMHELQGYTGEDVLEITAGNFKGAPIDVKYLANEVAEGYERAWVAGDEDGYVKPGATAIEYTITYNDIDGWAVGFEPVESYTVETETFYLPLAENIEPRAGGEFQNWTNELGEVVTEVEQGSTGDLVLYAAWKQAGINPVDEVIADKVEGYNELSPEDQATAYANVQYLYNKFEEVDLTEYWISNVYGKDAKIPAAKLAATNEELIDISVKYDLPIMTADVKVETAQATDGAFTFKLVDGGEGVNVEAAEIEEMIEWSDDLVNFAVNKDEIDVEVDDDNVTIKATFANQSDEPKGFMKLRLFRDEQ